MWHYLYFSPRGKFPEGKMLDLPASNFMSMLSCHCIGIDIIASFLCLAYGVGLRGNISGLNTRDMNEYLILDLHENLSGSPTLSSTTIVMPCDVISSDLCV